MMLPRGFILLYQLDDVSIFCLFFSVLKERSPGRFRKIVNTTFRLLNEVNSLRSSSLLLGVVVVLLRLLLSSKKKKKLKKSAFRERVF